MEIRLEIPEDIGRAIASARVSAERAAPETLAADAHRAGRISGQQIRRLLDLPSRLAVHEWLAAPQLPLRYSVSDLADDLATPSELAARSAPTAADSASPSG
jgi:hypothetical protein